jgi:hypothetical protein
VKYHLYYPQDLTRSEKDVLQFPIPGTGVMDIMFHGKGNIVEYNPSVPLAVQLSEPYRQYGEAMNRLSDMIREAKPRL